MLKAIDSFLNQYTMYKVALYGLLLLAVISFFLSVLGLLFYPPLQLALSVVLLGISCFVSNFIFSKILRAPTNNESYLISALILFFIYKPVSNQEEALTVVAAGVLAMASKYILAINNKHVFNPSAISAVVIGILGNGGALWWVGSEVLLPFVLIVGLLIVRKIRRFRLFFAFLTASLVSISIFQGINGGIPVQQSIIEAFASWPLIFFGTFMLTEPLTTPPTRKLQIIYGILVGLLFGAQFHIGPLYSTPELALVLGNIFSYIVSTKQKLFLKFKNKTKAAENTYEYIFTSPTKLNFKPGQYLEWTFPHAKPDIRGNRRYFTIASSPTEEDIHLGVRMEAQSSSFKRKLADITPEDTLVASQLTGDFTMPDDKNKKLVFIAGGIGITPFRSMVKYLMDKKEHRSIILFYANKTAGEIAYKELFEQAKNTIGLRPIYVLTSVDQIPTDWAGKRGRIDEKMLTEEVPDFKERTFYLSGPNAMVDAYKELLGKLGVPHHQIVTDYFPGF